MTEAAEAPVPTESDHEVGTAAYLAPIFKEAWETADAEGFEGRRTVIALRYLLDQQIIASVHPVTSLALVEDLCEAFHDAYERAAVGAGWETQEKSRKPWVDVPEANKETMRRTIRELLDARVILAPR